MASAVCGVAAVVAVGGCVGTTDREDFDRIIQERGGGFTSALPLDAIDAVAGEVGSDAFDVRSMNLSAPNETVVMEVRDPAAPENLDHYVVVGGEIDSVEPIQLSADVDLDVETFAVSSVAFDQIEALADQALAEFGRDDGYVSSMLVTQFGEGDVVIQLSLESSRATGTARFTAEGGLIEVVQT